MSSIQDIKNETVDLEKVYEKEKCTKEGLTTQEGEARVQIFGYNKLEEKESKILKFLGFMYWNFFSEEIKRVVRSQNYVESSNLFHGSWKLLQSWLFALANGDGRPPDWQDFVGIICLLVINSTISFIEENNAGNAAAALIAGLTPKPRDGKKTVSFAN